MWLSLRQPWGVLWASRRIPVSFLGGWPEKRRTCLEDRAELADAGYDPREIPRRGFLTGSDRCRPKAIGVYGYAAI
jgi:hypothetical protein